MTGQGTLIVVLGSLLACAAAVVALISFAEGSMALAIASAIATVAIIVGVVMMYRNAGKAGKAAFEQALAADFAADEQDWYHSSGLALDRTRRLLLVGSAKSVDRVPLDQISGVVYHANRTGPAFGGNSILTLILLPMAISAMIHNSTKAGLQVSAGGRTFRIVGIKPKDAERWQAALGA